MSLPTISLSFTPALQLIFANGMKGWYKPCGLRTEFPENELVAGALDYFIGALSGRLAFLTSPGQALTEHHHL